ncbi:hypothetical protein NC651_016216 [Populus alba x Populus x berolinensis]|nr:hypothetical protein NC651_016216 [Populus alba x Populus x berolinensis]
MEANFLPILSPNTTSYQKTDCLSNHPKRKGPTSDNMTLHFLQKDTHRQAHQFNRQLCH